ncbi:MAG TPA: signal peptide peptidase SppA [Gammaproteobacteria bacterium]|nr:signal peptide peptidase SppA [Gammaproteobacteria bacterium]
MAKRAHPVWRVLSGFLRGLDLLRRIVVNLLFLLIVAIIVVSLRGDIGPSVPQKAALVLAPQGNLVDRYGSNPANRALDNLLGRQHRDTRVRDLVTALHRAAHDGRIRVAVLDLSDMGHGGLSKLQEIGRAMHAFRKAGKKIFAYSDSYDQDQYYLASQATAAYMHPMGNLVIRGFGMYNDYYKGLLDKLKVQVHVFRVGKYKSAVEPYIRNDMSPAARQDNRAWLNELWHSYVSGVQKARGLPSGTIQNYADHYASLLSRVGGDSAELAVNKGLLDGLETRDQFDHKIAGIVGTGGSSGHVPFRHIGDKNYLVATHGQGQPKHPRGEVGIVVASGLIVDGSNVPGAISSDNMADLIRRARRDDAVKALVLRVDSPGGSAFGAEIIRRQVQLTRKAGKPVVVSMGSLAASGGYWISMDANRILASPTTITGSIGVFGMVPTFQKSLAAIGVHSDGVGTTSLAGGMRLDRPLSPEAGHAIQEMVDYTYRQFVHKVAKARGMKPAAVQKIAQGHVWSGEAAVKNGLVDQLGGLDQAVQEAAKMAGLKPGEYRRTYIRQPPSFGDRVIAWLGGAAPRGALASVVPGWMQRVLVSTPRPLRLLLMRDPRHVYALCECRAE